MNAVVPHSPAGGTALVPSSLHEAFSLAEMMARAKLVPKHLQGAPADCMLVIEQAARWRMSPFAVAQATSVIGGKLMFEGKLVGAAINTSGALDGRLEYEHSGSGDGRTCVATGTLRGEATKRTVSVTLRDVKTANGFWVKQPDQQLVYTAARVWARRHLPEVILGVYSPEEFDANDARDVTPAEPRPTMASIAAEPRSLERDGYDAALRGTDYLRTWKDALTKEQRIQVRQYLIDTLIPLAKENDPAPEQQDEIDRALDNAAAAEQRGLADEPEPDEMTQLIEGGEPADEAIVAQADGMIAHIRGRAMAAHINAYFDRPDIAAWIEANPGEAKRVIAARDARFREMAASNGGA
jgi:hypothetical protein